MNPKQLLQHFDRLSEAPDALPRLRRFILDLAVRGKLVEQDPNDEPASELIKRIRVDKARLMRDGKIKLQETLPAITKSEIEYELPTNWESTRIGELLTVIRGASPRPKGDPNYFSSERTPYHWIKISDIRKHSKNRVLYDTDEFLTKAGMEKSVLLPKGTLVMTNSATIGVPIFLGFDGGCIHDGYLAFPYFPDSEISRNFFFVLLQTLEAYAIKMARGMAQLNLNTGLVRSFPLGLPPLAEQQRIVAKVDELMALCDQLEAVKIKREQSRERLVAASLQRLNQPADDKETFREDARFTFSHLPRLTTRPAHIKQLRQTILNLAVRGKLVEQDPNDEPAAELLKRIRAEKAGLIKEGKLKKEKPLPEIVHENIQYELPLSWGWVRLADLSYLVTSGSRDWAKFYSDEGAIFLRMGNLSRGSYQLRLNSIQRVQPPQDREGARTKLEAGDILISITGEVGLLGLVPNGFGEAYINQHTCLVRPSALLRTRYLPELFRSSFAQDQFNEPQRGIKNSFRLTDVTEFIVPLPPLAEQHRIVAKVDELMALCDQLEAQLATTAADSRRLLEAVLHEALNPARKLAA